MIKTKRGEIKRIFLLAVIAVLFMLFLVTASDVTNETQETEKIIFNETRTFEIRHDPNLECLNDSDCNDDDNLTLDFCIEGNCSYIEIECLDNIDCNDSNMSTEDFCIDYFCFFNQTNQTQPVYECINDSDCDDQNHLTFDYCRDNNCSYVKVQCINDTDCDDNNQSTQDFCIDNFCVFIFNQTNITEPEILLLEQGEAEINKPVKWKAKIKAQNISHAKTILPFDSTTILEQELEEENNTFYFEYETPIITIEEQEINEVKEKDKSIGLTGDVISQQITQEKTIKKVTIRSNFSGHYHNVKAMTTINLNSQDQDIECYDDKTEIMTSKGWEYFSEFNNENNKNNVKVLTLNQETGKQGWQLPTAKQVYDYDGEMYNIELEDGSALVVSPKHKVYSSELTSEGVVNSITSLVLNTSTLDCFLNNLSLLQIGQFSFSANAKKSTSFKNSFLSLLEKHLDKDSASLRYLAYCSTGIKSTNKISCSLNEENSCLEIPDFISISDSYFLISLKESSGEISLCLVNKSLVNESFQKYVNNTLLSITNNIYNKPFFFNSANLPFFAFLPNSTDHLINSCSSLDSSFFNICSRQTNFLTFDSTANRINPDQLTSGNIFICSLTCPGTDNVILTILPPNCLDYVKKHNYVEVFKSFDLDNSEDLSDFNLVSITEVYDEDCSEHRFMLGLMRKIGIYEENQISSDFLKSDVENTLTADCCLNASSFDQIAQPNFNASANTGMSLSCGANCLAFDSNVLYLSEEKLDTYFSNSLIADLICSAFNLEYFNKSDLLSLSSCRLYAAVDNSKPSNPEFIIINLTGLSLKKDTNTLVSTTNSIYHPSALCLFQTRSLSLSPSLRQSSSVSSECSNILSNFLSNKALLTFSDKNFLTDSDQFISGKESNLCFSSSGTDNVKFGILIPPHNLVYPVKDVQLFKSFDLTPISEVYADIILGKDIYFLNQDNQPIKVKSITKQPYKGKIYDVDVPNDIILVKRNNLIVWSGNSNPDSSTNNNTNNSSYNYPYETQQDQIKVYHLINQSNQTRIDITNNPVYNLTISEVEASNVSASNETNPLNNTNNTYQTYKISWIVPELSEQVFEITGGQGGPSILDALPDNQSDELWLNMTGNVLLFHFDNDSAVGENSSVVKDFSGNGNNGSVTGAVFTSSGKVNGSYDFDGGIDSISVNYDTSLNMSESFTISAWIYPKSPHNASLGGIWYDYYNSWQNRLVVYDNGELRAQVRIGGADVAVTKPGAITNDVWNHVVLRYNSTSLTLHVDGVEIANTTTSGVVSYSTNSRFIGRGETGANMRYFNGSIDDLAIFNRSLSANEVLQLYQAGLGKRGLSTCGDLEADSSYILVDNVAGDTTCFNITGDNIVLDGNGYTINYSDTGTGYGINNSGGFDNITVKNCKMEQIGTSANSYGVYYNGGMNGTISNNTGNSSFFSSDLKSILIGQSGENNFTNCTINSAITFVSASTGSLNIHHYLDAQVNYTNSTGIQDADVLAYDVNNTLYFNESTGKGGTQSGLVSWWEFEDASGTNADDSIGSNDGTLEGAVNWTKGKLAGGLEFDGIGDAVNVPSSIDLKGTGTISMWISPKFRASNYLIEHYNTAADDRVGFVWEISSNNLGAFLQDDGVYAYTWNGFVVSTSGWTLGDWHYIVFSWDNTTGGDNMFIYVDGVLGNSVEGDVDYFPDTAGSNNRIGAHVGGAVYFNGTIDEVKIYNRALSPQEVMEDYQNSRIKRQTVLEYMQNSTQKYMKTNYTINATKNNIWTRHNRRLNITTNFIDNSKLQLWLNPDITFPLVNWTAPTPDNASHINKNYIYLNTTTSDETGHYGIFDFNNSLVGWWRFEENESTVAEDMSVYKNNGTLTGFSSTEIDEDKNSGWTSAGYYGQGLRFDGVDDYVNMISPIPDLNYNKNFTITGWFNHKSTEGMIIQNNPFPSNYVIIQVKSSSLRAAYYDGASYTSKSGIVSLDTWYFFSFSVLDGVINLSINMVEQTGTSGPGNNGAPIGLNIGSRSGGDGNYFNGTIDELKIYNRALSVEEINASYNAGTYRLEHNFTAISDGSTINYTAYVVDKGGHLNRTDLWQTTIQLNVFAHITLEDPLNNTWNATRAVNFTFTATDDKALQNCSSYLYYSNGSFINKQTNLSAVENDTLHGIELTLPYDGFDYLWAIECYDSNNARNVTSNRTIKIGCGNLYEDKTYNHDVTADETCLTIGANDLIVDGNSHTINYSSTSIGNAINNTNYNGTTIKNLNVKEISDNNGYGIYIRGENILIQNNNFTNFAESVYIFNSSNISVVDNTVNSTDNYGIWNYKSSNNNISDNLINVYGFGKLGIAFDELNYNNTAKNNVIISTGDSGYSIYLYQAWNHTIENNIFNYSGDNGWNVLIAAGSHLTSFNNNTLNTLGSSNSLYLSKSQNNTIINNTIKGGTYGIYFDSGQSAGGGSSNNYLENNKIYDVTTGIYFLKQAGVKPGSPNNNNTFILNYINNSGDSAISLLRNNFDNEFKDVIINNSASYDFYWTGATTSGNNTFLNTTHNKEKISIINSGTLYVKWYLDAYVNYSNSSNASNANVKFFDNNETLQYQDTTESDGMISRQNVSEYYQNSTSKYFFINYSVNATKGKYISETEQVNLTTNAIDNNKIVLTLDTDVPNVTLISPATDSSVTTATVTLICNSSDDSGLSNVTLLVWNSAGVTVSEKNTTVSGTVNLTTFSYTLPAEGTYTWNCRAVDTSNNNGTAESNFSLTYTIPSGGGPGGETPGGGGGAGGGGGPLILGSFELDPKEFIIGMDENQELTEEFDITNTGEIYIFVITNLGGEIAELITINSTDALNARRGLTLDETKTVKIHVKSGEAGIYVGTIKVKAGGISKSILTSIGVGTAMSMFDAKVTIPNEYKSLEQGDPLKAEINLFRIGKTIHQDVTITYLIKDSLGNIVLEQSETFAIADQKSYTKEFDTTELKNGNYVLGIELRYHDQVAVSSDSFKIGEPFIPKLPFSTIKYIIISIFLISGILVLVIIIKVISKMRKSQKMRF